MAIFEASLEEKIFGAPLINFSDIAVYALFGNMIRCLPELEPDLMSHAPQIHAHCHKIGSPAPLANYVAESKVHGHLYRDGQIEASIERYTWTQRNYVT